MNWNNILEVLVRHHLHSFDFYRPHSSNYNDLQILQFVRANILGMSLFHRTGVVLLLLTLNILAFFSTGRFMTHIAGDKLEGYISSQVRYFPFDLLNKLICGNMYIRLFEIVPGKSS